MAASNNKGKEICNEFADLEAERRKASSRRCRCWTLNVFAAVLSNLHEVLMGNKLCLLFPLVPVAMLLDRLHLGNAWVFSVSFVALAPLAERLGFLTEQLAFYTGDTVGGLLNATCGNATELIIAILALHHGKMDVVKYSLLGSVLSNLLLVAGTSLFFGGLVNMNKPQNFDKGVAGINICMLILGCTCMLMPTAVQHQQSHDGSNKVSLAASRGASVVMLLAYAGYLLFQLKTHAGMFQQQHGDENQHDSAAAIVESAMEAAAAPAARASAEDENDGEEKACLGFWNAVSWLCLMTAAIAVLSHYVVNTIEDVAVSWHISSDFIAMVLLPIVGNAAEHAAAVLFAFRNNLDLSLAVALGSATQVAMFLIPVTVLMGWATERAMELKLREVESVAMVGSVAVAAYSLHDGTSNYMKGLLMLLLYVAVSLCFLLLRQPAVSPVNASALADV